MRLPAAIAPQAFLDQRSRSCPSRSRLAPSKCGAIVTLFSGFSGPMLHHVGLHHEAIIAVHGFSGPFGASASNRRHGAAKPRFGLTRLLRPVRPGVSTKDSAPGAHHARPERPTGSALMIVRWWQ
jgi:hypothetical protein